MFALNFDDSVFSLKDFKYDGENSYYYRSYQIQKHSTVNIDKLVALNAILTNCNLFEGKFTNTSCLHNVPDLR